VVEISVIVNGNGLEPEERWKLYTQADAATDRQIDQLVYQRYDLTDEKIVLVDSS